MALDTSYARDFSEKEILFGFLYQPPVLTTSKSPGSNLSEIDFAGEFYTFSYSAEV